MADNDGLGGEPTVGSFSKLLFAADDVGLENGDGYHYKSFFSSSDQCAPKMLCFGDYRNACDLSNTLSETTRTTGQKSGVTCSNSSSTSTANKSTGRANRKRNGSGSGGELVQGSTAGAGAPAAGGQRNCKKTKSEAPTLTGHGKKQGKREKLGDRITTLQQLVSPYGKTDTASVLHEAMGYIRFLHEQVQVLCSPYLQRLPMSSNLLLHPQEAENGEESEARNDLRSRGLCLVPIECTEHLANNNGADYWSPAAMAYTNPARSVL